MEPSASQIYLEQLSELDLPNFTQAAALKRAGEDNKLIEALLPMVVKVARRFCQDDPQIFDDLVQAGNLAAIMAVNTWSPDGGLAVTTWAMPQIRREISRERRRAYEHVSHVDVESLDHWSVDDLDSIHLVDNLCAVDDRIVVDKFLDTLDETERHLVVGAFIHGKGIRELAEELGVSKTRCYKMLQIILQKPGTLLENAGIK